MKAAGYRLADALAMSSRVQRESGVTLVSTDGNRVHVRV